LKIQIGFGNFWKLLETSGNLWKLLETLPNLFWQGFLLSVPLQRRSKEQGSGSSRKASALKKM